MNRIIKWWWQNPMKQLPHGTCEKDLRSASWQESRGSWLSCQRVYLAGTVILCLQSITSTREEKREGQTLQRARLPTWIPWEDRVRLFEGKRKGWKRGEAAETKRHKALTTSAKAEITFPNVVRDLLMFAPSCKYRCLLLKSHQCNAGQRFAHAVSDNGRLTFSRVPVAPVESARSLPAKSTRLILLTWRGSQYIWDASSLWIIYIRIITNWERMKIFRKKITALTTVHFVFKDFKICTVYFFKSVNHSNMWMQRGGIWQSGWTQWALCLE